MMRMCLPVGGVNGSLAAFTSVTGFMASVITVDPLATGASPGPPEQAVIVSAEARTAVTDKRARLVRRSGRIMIGTGVISFSSKMLRVGKGLSLSWSSWREGIARLGQPVG